MDTRLSLKQITRSLQQLNVGMVQPWDHDATRGVHDNDPLLSSSSQYDRINMESSPSVYSNETITTGYALHHGTNMTDTTTTGVPHPTSPWWITFTFIILFFVVICVSLVVRDGCIRFLCPEADQYLHTRHSQRPVSDEEEEDGRQLSPEEVRERQLEKQRQERRLWYHYYLKPHITVLTEEHFMTGDKKEQDNDKHELEETKQQPSAAGHACEEMKLDGHLLQEKAPNDSKENPDDQEHDVENPCTSTAVNDDTAPTTTEGQQQQQHYQEPDCLVCQPTTTIPLGGDDLLLPSTKMMTLWDAHDTTFRQVEANCSICLNDYEVGDTIVRSAAKEEEEYCIHVFHYDCMMLWLSQGKKRCPICRHWFVPSVRIKDQMKEAHIVMRNSLHHLYDARTMQGIASLNDDNDGDTTDSNMSRSFDDDDLERGTVTTAGAHVVTAATPEVQPTTTTEPTPSHHEIDERRRTSYPQSARSAHLLHQLPTSGLTWGLPPTT